jgi:replicative DNA helicase
MVTEIPVEAEQALLGVLLTEPSSWDQVSDVVRDPHFGVEAHRRLAGVLIDLLLSRKAVDPLLVQAECERRQVHVPGDLALRLGAAVGTSAHLREYALLVRSAWVRRSVKEVAARIAADDSPRSGEELAAELARQATLLETARSRPAVRLDELLLARAEWYEAQALAARQGRPVPSRRIPTGFARLDALLGGFGVGHLTLVAGRPSAGKTAFESALADNLAAHGNPTYIFQLEDFGESLADRAISRRARITTPALRDASVWDARAWERVMEATARSLPIWVDDEHQLTPLDIAGKMRRAKREHGIRVFMLDVLAELDVEAGNGGGREERFDRLLGKGVRFLRDTARDLDAGLVIFHHLNREIERRSDPTPRLSDLKNSGDLEDAAHVVLFLSRPEKGGMTLDLAKNRDGPTGRVSLGWLEDYSAVTNPKDPFGIEEAT